jgi:isopenicillin-N epimerase
MTLEQLLGRRDLLVRTGLLLGAAGLGPLAAGCEWGGEESAGEDTDLAAATSSWAGVRAQFELDSKRRHFSAFLLAPHPRPVREAIDRHRRGLDANPAEYIHEHQMELEGSVVAAAASFLGGRPSDFALTDSTTMGLALLYNGIALRAGQEVLTTDHDFFSTHESLRLRALRSGATVRKVRLYDDGAHASEDEIVSRLIDAVRPSTRVVALTWVHSGTGVKLPIAAIGAALAERRGGALDSRPLLCVDAVHALGAEEMSLDALGCDFLVAGCHKWLFGPRGTGIVWASDEAWRRCDATIPSFSDNDEFLAWLEQRAPREGTSAQRMTPGGFHSFEHRWALAQAFDFQRSIGMQQVARRTRQLAGRLKEGLAQISGVRLHTPAAEELSAGLVCFEVGDQRPDKVVEALGPKGIVATVTPYAAEYVRLGTTVLVSEDDVDAAVRGIAELV